MFRISQLSRKSLSRRSHVQRRHASSSPDKRRVVALAKGDGIGPEIVDVTLDIIRATGAPVDFVEVQMGLKAYQAGHKIGMTDEAKGTVEKCGVLLKGPMETPKGKGMKSINVTARKTWSTYANKRRFRSLVGVDTVFSRAGIPIDLTVIRENIEDTYGAVEHMQTHDVAQCRRFITRPGSIQVHRYAFELARLRHSRTGAKHFPRVTCVHKANIMKLTDGMFLDCFYQLAKDYPEIKADDIIVDDACMKLVSRPDRFGIMVVPNLQGDIISDLAAGLVGGLGFAPSANIGERVSIFEAVHGTAPDIAGKNSANPAALIMSATMMLRHIGLTNYGIAIDTALMSALTSGACTRDFSSLGTADAQPLSTTQFAKAVIDRLPPVFQEPEKGQFFMPQPEPLTNPLLVSAKSEKENIVGIDVFIESTDQPDVIATKLKAQVCDNNAKVTMISNRGTQVWPTGSKFTELVNHYRVRIEMTAPGNHTSAALLQYANSVASVYRVCSVEMLMQFGDHKGFSLAQGQ